MKGWMGFGFLITVCMTFFSPIYAGASNFMGDMEIFKECTVSAPANILFLIDTSASMMSPDVIYYQGAERFSHDGDYSPFGDKNPDTIYCDDDGVWRLLYDKKFTKETIKCPLHREHLRLNGYSVGPLQPNSSTCAAEGLAIYRLATGRYLNYLNYLAAYMADIVYADSGYDAGIDYGSQGYDGSLLGSPKGRHRLYSNDGISVSPLCSTGPVFVADIVCGRGEVCEGLVANREVLETRGAVKDLVIDPCLLKGEARSLYVYTGNFLNYMALKFGRRYVAIRAIKKAISRHPDLRYGIMQFDLDFSEVDSEIRWENDGGDLSLPCAPGDAEYTWDGSIKSHTEMLDILLTGGWNSDADAQYLQPLYFGQCIGTACEAKETPLAESLVEAGLYFAGASSLFNRALGQGGQGHGWGNGLGNGKKHRLQYTSPIVCNDQRSFIIIVTDGKPHSDFTYLIDGHHKILHSYSFPLPSVEKIIGDYDADGEDLYKETWADDVAKFLFDNDFSSLLGHEHVEVYPIGLAMGVTEGALDASLLQDIADNGQGFSPQSGLGLYFTARTEDDIEDALHRILSMADDFTFAFSRASAPICVADGTYSGGDVFVSDFKMRVGHRGEGNITRYARCGDTLQGIRGGVLTDLFDAGTGARVEGVVDLWAPLDFTHAGTDSACMGAASVLKRALDGVQVDAQSLDNTLAHVAAVRKLKTAHGSYGNWATVGLTDDAVVGASPSLEIQKREGGAYSGDALKQFLIHHLYGVGLAWPLGESVHASMMVVHYPKGSERDSGSDPYIFSGHNDGMLHCFDASDGHEVWGFIPPDIFVHRLDNLRSPGAGDWFVDGGMAFFYSSVSPGSTGQGGSSADYTVRTPKYLVFGERRGGYRYHVLDISTKESPVYEGYIGGGDEWGESWGMPTLCQVKTSASGDPIKGVLVGGGYDTNQDQIYPDEDTTGRFVAIYDFFGRELKRLPQSISMDACVVGATIIDHDRDGARLFSRIYAGDLKGNVFHFADDRTGGVDAAPVDGQWYEHRLFESQHFTRELSDDTGGAEVRTIYQKIFYPPILGYSCRKRMIFFGTGDGEHPLRTDMTDSIYGVYDHWSGGPYTTLDLTRFDLSPEPEGRIDRGMTHETYAITGCKESCGDDKACKERCTEQNKGWYFDFPAAHKGEKLISAPLIMGGNMVFGTYTPPTPFVPLLSPCDTGPCITGEGRVYVVNTCSESFAVKSYKLPGNPMPQTSLLFDKESGKVLISTGCGAIIDPDIPVIATDYWKHSGSDL